MKTEAKLQHYLPKSYLYGFSENLKTVWVYDKKLNTLKELSPEVFGGENHFYTIKNKEGEKDTSIEDMFVEVDGVYMSILRKIRNQEQLSSEDRKEFSLILALFMNRTPSFKSFSEDMLNEIMKRSMNVHAQHKDAFYSKLRMLGVKEDDLEENRKFALEGEYDISPSRNYTIEQMVQLSLDIAPMFNMFKWTVGIVPKKTSFMTTDNPISLIPNKDVSSNPFQSVRLLTEGVTVHFPLDKNLLLGMQFTETPTEEITYGKVSGRESIRMINHDLFLCAYRYVIAKDKKWLEKIIKLYNSRI